jgi:hypothetical protein
VKPSTEGAVGHRSFKGQSSHLGCGALQISRPRRISPTCIGVFREVERPIYGEAMMSQLATATERLGEGSLERLLHSGDTWVVS